MLSVKTFRNKMSFTVPLMFVLLGYTDTLNIDYIYTTFTPPVYIASRCYLAYGSMEAQWCAEAASACPLCLEITDKEMPLKFVALTFTV